MTSWVEFAILGVLMSPIMGTLNIFLYNANPHFFFFIFQQESFTFLMVYTFVFSLFEKMRKESFIINYTHSKTKKTLIALFN